MVMENKSFSIFLFKYSVNRYILQIQSWIIPQINSPTTTPQLDL